MLPKRLLIRSILFVCVSKEGGLAFEYREGHLQWVHPIGDWRFYFYFECFVEGNHYCDLKIGRETAFKTLNSCGIERVSMQNPMSNIFKLTFETISSVKMWGHLAVSS